MSTLLRTVASLTIATLTGFAPVVAFAAETMTPIGTYQTTDRKMDFALMACGPTGAKLCVKIAAARGDADSPRVHPYIGKYMVDHANPAGKNVWKGAMDFQGTKLDGSLTLKPGVSFVMHGCAYVVICSDFNLIPALPAK